MKPLIFAGLFLSAIMSQPDINVNSLMPDSSAPLSRDTATIAGNWHLVPVMPSDTAAGNIPQLNFDITTNKFSGNSGYNKMGGSFAIQQDALSFGENIISTKMACPGYNEQAFLDNLLKTNRYQIKDGVLQLMYNTTILSQWTRHADTLTTKQI